MMGAAAALSQLCPCLRLCCRRLCRCLELWLSVVLASSAECRGHMCCRVPQPQQVRRCSLVGHQRTQQVPEGEVGPQHGAEHQQSLPALPQEEVAETALS